MLRISIVILRLRNISLSFILLKEFLSSLNWQSIAETSFAILVTYLQTVLTRAEIAITKYTPTFSILVGVAAVPEAVLGVLGISERVKGAAAERVPLRLRTLLRVGVLGGGEVSKGEMVRVRSYIDISNIRIIKMRILYLFSRRFSWIISRS